MHERSTAWKIRVEPMDDAPTEGTVCHYDELTDEAKHHLDALANGSSASARLDAEVAEELVGCEHVKFTDYYRVQSS
ncbi:hypothetical protein ACFQH6_11035 [Halobacteriaceae archaeon GCM10025711]